MLHFLNSPLSKFWISYFLRSDIECESLWLLAHYKIFLLFYPKPYSQFEQMDLLKRKWTQFIVNFPFLDGDVPRSASYGVYISQLIRSARVSSHVDDFNTRNKVLTAKLLRQGYRYHKLLKAFSKCYRRHSDIVSKYNFGLKTLLLQGLSEPELYSEK